MTILEIDSSLSNVRNLLSLLTEVISSTNISVEHQESAEALIAIINDFISTHLSGETTLSQLDELLRNFDSSFGEYQTSFQMLLNNSL